MCGRYGFSQDGTRLVARYELLSQVVNFQPRYNIAPSQILPVITNQNKKQIEMMKWGLIPSWAKDINIGNKMINARVETLAVSKVFKKPLQSTRCLVPATFFYEWKKLDDRKEPFLIKVIDQEIFSFAGLFDVARDGEGREIRSYTIITTQANDFMQDIHGRMPVILKKIDEDKWLDPERNQAEDLVEFLHPYPSNQMESYMVSRGVNSPANDSPNLIDPV